MLVNQWFYLAIIAFASILYLIISKICETWESIKIAECAKLDNNEYDIHFKDIDDLDAFIDELQNFKEHLLKNKKEGSDK